MHAIIYAVEITPWPWHTASDFPESDVTAN